MRRLGLIVAALAIFVGTTAPRRAEPVPTIHNDVITCPDGSQAHDFQPDGPPPDAATLRTICQMNAALHAERSAPVPPVAPSRQMSSQEVEERFRRSLGVAPTKVPAIMQLPGQSSVQKLPSPRFSYVPGPPQHIFTMTHDEFNKAYAMCADVLGARTGAALVAAADILPICGCRLRAMQKSLTHAEFNAYMDWELWRTTWRHYIWTVDLPKGVAEKLADGARSCAN